MKRLTILALMLCFAFAITACNEGSPTSSEQDLGYADDLDLSSDELVLGKHGGVATFEITLKNLTPATGAGASQVLSPPVLASHGRFTMFRVGRRASKELAMIAEDAVNGPMLDLLNKSRRVFDVVEGGGVIPPGASDTYTLKLKPGFTKISFATMLVNTNDGFTGVSGLRPPAHGTKVFYLKAYDAGSEDNTELKKHIPGPCCGNPLVRVPTHDRIKHHRGILGVGDLDPDIYGWKGAVAKLTITRVD